MAQIQINKSFVSKIKMTWEILEVRSDKGKPREKEERKRERKEREEREKEKEKREKERKREKKRGKERSRGREEGEKERKREKERQRKIIACHNNCVKKVRKSLGKMSNLPIIFWTILPSICDNSTHRRPFYVNLYCQIASTIQNLQQHFLNMGLTPPLTPTLEQS